MSDLARGAAALYVHVPFCESKCSYCDFYSVPHDGSGRAKYVSALALEGARRRPRDFRPATTFVGGGTPTALSDADFAEMLRVVAELAGAPRDADPQRFEWSVECNPGSLTHAKAAMMRAAGVTRASIGVQSFDDRILRSVGRVHDAATARDAVRIARDAGIPQVSVDLLFAIPGQGMATFEADLDAAIALGTDHVSAYALLYEDGTVLERRLREGRVEPEEEDVELAMLRRAHERLGAAGFERYEISNFAKPGCACRHNINYWRNGEYLGIGASAASYLGGERRTNVASWRDYEDAVHRGHDPVASAERLAPDRAAGEEAMLRLRMREGMSLRDVSARWGIDAAELWRPVISRFTAAGLLAAHDGGDRVTLTARGLEVANGVMAEFVVPDQPASTRS
ncbi:MAG: Oxygen-independent coproporphyrinogen-III oxidase-like protein YqeR [Planctomycetes bacterium]|nr:Oxygen-independent coproporphyrinogen-III oxidase-like protein YqeR [Planctomycetota bacterium]